VAEAFLDHLEVGAIRLGPASSVTYSPNRCPPAPQVGGAPLGYPGLGGLPRTIGVLLPPERPG
jgi:hypothetical protein